MRACGALVSYYAVVVTSRVNTRACRAALTARTGVQHPYGNDGVGICLVNVQIVLLDVIHAVCAMMVRTRVHLSSSYGSGRISVRKIC